MDPVYVFLVNPFRAFAIAGVTGFAAYWFICWLARPTTDTSRVGRSGPGDYPARQAKPED